MSGAPRFEPAGFTDAVLEAAASKGLVRRARRDVEAGLAAPASWENGTAVLACDGETVRLPPGPLAGAACTCPAGGACRHILAAVIALRDMPPPERLPDAEAPPAPPPAQPDVLAEIRTLTPTALAKAFGRAALVRAEGLLAALSPEEVRIEAEPGLARIRLGDHPEVHAPAGAGPAGLVSKADRVERPTLHAAALLAVLAPETIGRPAAADDAEPAAAPDPGTGVTDAVAAVLRDAARQALSSAPVALEERLSDLVLSSRVEAMPRLAAELRALAAAIRSRRERSTEDEPHALLGRIAHAYALAEALRVRPDDAALSGAGRDVAEALPEALFVGCGLELWRTGSGARGVTAHLLRAEDGKPFTLTLARAAGADPGFSPTRASQVEAIFAQTLARLAAGIHRLDGAAAGADGRLSQRAGQATADPAPWRAAIDAVPGAVLADWTDAAARLTRDLRPALGGSFDRGLPLVLRPAALGPLAFDGVAQIARFPIQDMSGRWLELEIAGDERLESKLGTLEAARRAPRPPLLCILARLRGDAVVLTPTGIEGERLRLLDLPSGREAPQPARSFFGDWAKRFDAAATALRGRPDEPRFALVPAPHPTRLRLARAASDEILALAELGGRMEDPDRLARINRLAADFRRSGLDTSAKLLDRLATAPRPSRAHHLLTAAYALDTLARLEPRLPFVAPV